MKPKAELMARTRKARKEAGLVRVEVWVTPAQAEKVREYAKWLKQTGA